MSGGDYYLGTLGSEQLLSANDATFSSQREMLATEQRLCSGVLIRYKQAQMQHWNFQYKYLPGQRKHVYDGGMGRNDLYALYQADNEMSFLTPQDVGPQISHTVRFAMGSWREQKVMRSGDFWAWSVSFELVETK